MPFPKQVLTELETVFARAGRQLRNTEFLANQLATQVSGLAFQGVLWLAGHATSDTGKKHQVVKDASGQHYLVDNNNVLHKVG
jgi:hypothetical protein